jgi:putative ABC transport system permease protein
VHEDLKNTIKAIDGVDKTAALTFQNIQLPTSTIPIRVTAVGYDPFGEISAINPKRIVQGRALKRDHYEIVVSQKTGFELNDLIPLGRHTYKVVGITKGTVASGGDPLVFLSFKDAGELQFSYSNNRIRTDRLRGLKTGDSHLANAVVATIKPGYSVDTIANEIRKFQHKSVYTADEQRTILTKNVIKNASKQIGLFTVILVVVSTIIIALIIYTMTLEKMKEIAIMKLIGIPNSMIIKMIVQETMLLGFLAFIFGNLFAHLIYQVFPKRVVLLKPDAWELFIVIIIASILASIVAIKKVIKADPRSAIGG